MANETDEVSEIRNLGIESLHGRPSVMPGYHRHREIELNFLERGTMTYLFAGRRHVVPEGRLAVFWATFPHQTISTGEDVIYYCLYWPLAHVLRWNLPDTIAGALLNGHFLVDDDPTHELLDRALFPLWHGDVTSGDGGKIPLLDIEIEARLRRMSTAPIGYQKAVTKGVERQALREAGDARKTTQMALYLAENYGESVRISEVAELVDLHPKYAMSLFRKCFGITMVSYVNQHRLAHAQRLLVTTDLSVSEIGYDSGFGSASRFYEVFVKACGQSPIAFRRAMRGHAVKA